MKLECVISVNAFSQTGLFINTKQSVESIKKDNIKSLVFHKDEEFVKEILNSFRDGAVGDFLSKDKIVQMIGYKHFCVWRNELCKSRGEERGDAGDAEVDMVVLKF